MRLAVKVATAVLIVDQVSKYTVVHGLGLDRKLAMEVLPPWINFRMAWNQGVNFGLFSGQSDWTRWALILLALGISVWVWLWVRREPHSALVQVAAGLLIGGALGNVVDRLLYGAVAEFPEPVGAGNRKPLFVQRGRYRDLCRCRRVGSVHRA